MDVNLNDKMPLAISIPVVTRTSTPHPFMAAPKVAPKGIPGRVNSSTSKVAPHTASTKGGHTSGPINGDTSGKKGVNTGT